MSRYEGSFERAAEASLAALGASPGDPALDAWSDPAGAAQALSELGAEQPAILRASADLASAQDAAAQAGAAPLWLRLTRGSAEVLASTTPHPEPPHPETRRVTRVLVDAAPLPDGSDGFIARVALVLDRKPGAPSKLLAAEAWARAEDVAVARVRPVAARLARTLSVPASLPAEPAAKAATSAEPAAASTGPAATESTDAAEEPHAPQVSARALARFALRTEGARLVLRDFASRGPREAAGLHLVIGLAFAALAAGAWAMFARSAGLAGIGAGVSIAWIGGSVLLTLAAVAFLGVAQFARRYAAESAPLVAIGAGKLTVAPWVDRSGAVVPEPEGRFGAAIDLGEVRGVSVQDRNGRHALEFATDHGPIDALVIDDPTIALYLSAALSRIIDDLRPQTAAPTARQRARMRAAGSTPATPTTPASPTTPTSPTTPAAPTAPAAPTTPATK